MAAATYDRGLGIDTGLCRELDGAFELPSSASSSFSSVMQPSPSTIHASSSAIYPASSTAAAAAVAAHANASAQRRPSDVSCTSRLGSEASVSALGTGPATPTYCPSNGVFVMENFAGNVPMVPCNSNDTGSYLDMTHMTSLEGHEDMLHQVHDSAMLKSSQPSYWEPIPNAMDASASSHLGLQPYHDEMLLLNHGIPTSAPTISQARTASILASSPHLVMDPYATESMAPSTIYAQETVVPSRLCAPYATTPRTLGDPFSTPMKRDARYAQGAADSWASTPPQASLASSPQLLSPTPRPTHRQSVLGVDAMRAQQAVAAARRRRSPPAPARLAMPTQHSAHAMAPDTPPTPNSLLSAGLSNANGLSDEQADGSWGDIPRMSSGKLVCTMPIIDGGPPCTAKFARREHLNRHYNSSRHTREKRHTCAKCGRPFDRPDNLRAHIKNTHIKPSVKGRCDRVTDEEARQNGWGELLASVRKSQHKERLKVGGNVPSNGMGVGLGLAGVTMGANKIGKPATIKRPKQLVV